MWTNAGKEYHLPGELPHSQIGRQSMIESMEWWVEGFESKKSRVKGEECKESKITQFVDSNETNNNYYKREKLIK